jgi:hypothetical protein
MASAPRPPTDDVRLLCALCAAALLGEVVSLLAAGDRPVPPAGFPRHLIDVNSAHAGEIEVLPGVGRVVAERIVAERARRRFASLDDLDRVPGVGPTTLARLRPFATCGEGLEVRVESER